MPEEVNYNHVQTPKDVQKNSVSNSLPPSVRHQFEAQMGEDLSSVRVHQGHGATLRGAQAYAAGDDIFFAPGQYDPHSQAGRELLGHELTHVVQQRGARCGPSSLVAGMTQDGTD